jgi:hypothetical protein
MEPQSGDRCAHSGKKAVDAGDHEDHEATHVHVHPERNDKTTVAGAVQLSQLYKTVHVYTSEFVWSIRSPEIVRI